MTQIRRGREPLIADRPMVTATSDGGVRLELGSIDQPWTVELTLADCERVAEAIGFVRPGYFQVQAPDSDS
jgi:hypothetical protein